MRWFAPSPLAADAHADHIHINIYPKEPINMTTNSTFLAERLERWAADYEARAATYRRQAEETRREAKRRAEPELPTGALLVWARQFSPAGKTYTYSAVKGHNGRYYTTDRGPCTWAELAAANPDTLVTIYSHPLRSEIAVPGAAAFRSVRVMTARW